MIHDFILECPFPSIFITWPKGDQVARLASGQWPSCRQLIPQSASCMTYCPIVVDQQFHVR